MHLVDQLSIPTFCRSFEHLVGNAPVIDGILSSQEQETYLTTPLDQNCIEFEFQMDRKYYVRLRQNFMASKLKLIKCFG